MPKVPEVPKVRVLSVLRCLVLGCAALVCALRLAGAVAQGSQQTTFHVGVIDSSGLIQPVARFDGERWSNTWPEPVDRHAKIPTSIDAVPAAWLGGAVPLQWRRLATGTDAATPQPESIRVTGVGRVVSCFGSIALTTDMPNTKRDRHEIVSVVVSSDATGHALRQLPTGPRAALVALERRARKQLGGGGGGSVAAHFYAPVGTNSDVLFVTYELTLARRGVWLSGWLRSDGGFIRVESMMFPGETAGRRLDPIYVIGDPGSDRPFWVMRERGYESSSIVLFTVEADGASEMVRALRDGC